MDTIVTPVSVITLDSTRIVHSIKVDLVARYFPPFVRLVQYDQSLPVIAVSLMQNGQTYSLPSGAAANIRVHKPDSTYVYNPALGCDSTRNIVYFEVTQAMAAANGDGLAIVEIVVDGDIAGSSLITLHFEDNPVPEDAIESSDEWETIYELGERIIASTVTPVSTAAGMTDHNVVYLYTGTESGWNQGHMYYYNGTTWVDAGIAVTDTTLSVAGLAADAKKTGDEITALKEDLTELKIETGILYENEDVPRLETLFTSSDVSVGTTIYYSFTVESGKSCYLEFLDSNNSRITFIGKGSSSGGDLSYSGSYRLPLNFAKCVISGSVGAVMTFGYIKTDYSNIKLKESLLNQQSEVLKNLYEVVNIEAIPTTGGLYSIVTYEYYASPNYKYYLLPATALDEVYVTAESNTNVPIAMFYSDTDTLDSTTWLGSQGDYASSVQYTNEKLNIPIGTQMIAVNCTIGGDFNILKSISATDASKKIKASYDGNNVVLSSAYSDDSNLRVTMGYQGGNNLFDFRSFVEVDTDGTETTLLTNSTDFFGPYKVRATSNADGDLPDNWYSHFCGGNHQYNNSGSGSTPTARGAIDFVLFDGREVSSGADSYCNRVEIQWTNYIQGQNTKKADGTGREILKETYNLVFDGYEFKIRHSFVPLEDVIIITYYGLQLYNNTTGCKYRYIGGDTRNILTAPIASTSGNILCREIVMENTSFRTSMKTETTDLGDFSLDDSGYSVFTSASNKAYFNLISPSTNTTFSMNDYYYFDGSYRFEKVN